MEYFTYYDVQYAKQISSQSPFLWFNSPKYELRIDIRNLLLTRMFHSYKKVYQSIIVTIVKLQLE